MQKFKCTFVILKYIVPSDFHSLSRDIFANPLPLYVIVNFDFIVILLLEKVVSIYFMAMQTSCQGVITW